MDTNRRDVMIIWSIFFMSCSSQEQPDADFSYLTISQVMPFLDLTYEQKLSPKLFQFILSKQQFCPEAFFVDSNETNQKKQNLSFQGDCLFDVDSESSQKSKNIREEQIFAHPFHEDSVLTISFPYGNPTKNLPFFHHVSKHTRMEGKITISPTTINAEGFSVYQQQEDNTENLVLYLDGIITSQHQPPNLQYIEISGLFCGIFVPCESKPWQVDLRHELRIEGKEHSQVTIGSITQNRSISVESSFFFDELFCDLRPISGHIGIEKGIRYDMTFEKSCDNCALISQQGKPSVLFCNDLP